MRKVPQSSKGETLILHGASVNPILQEPRGFHNGRACMLTSVLHARVPERLIFTSSSRLYQLLLLGSGVEPVTGSLYQRCAVVQLCRRKLAN
ncbi:hypothetical protein OCU04_012094 [Sclerotinia nivalis]|uniref:Uncharacterized protein n=1 Tax=Sclerotinia nivalis TaxID=352851 RepID=A0A9X0DEX7_9HELO|nr:hypothetical protein OCU04_012094 [Sclerotinia nivalis]